MSNIIFIALYTHVDFFENNNKYASIFVKKTHLVSISCVKEFANLKLEILSHQSKIF